VSLCLQDVQRIYGDLYETVDYPARGFAFQLYGHTVNSMARWIDLYCVYSVVKLSSLSRVLLMYMATISIHDIDYITAMWL